MRRPLSPSILSILGAVGSRVEAAADKVWPLPGGGVEAVLARRRERLQQRVRTRLAGDLVGAEMGLLLLYAACTSHRAPIICIPMPPAFGGRMGGMAGGGITGGSSKDGGAAHNFDALARSIEALPPLSRLRLDDGAAAPSLSSSASSSSSSDPLAALSPQVLRLLYWATGADAPSGRPWLDGARSSNSVGSHSGGKVGPTAGAGAGAGAAGAGATAAGATASASAATRAKTTGGLPDNCELVLRVKLPGNPKFEGLAAQHGRIRAFHGSQVENFHSILHNGLRNMSGTKEMRTGAAFGEGIYLAANLNVALMYGTTLPIGHPLWQRATHLLDAQERSKASSSSSSSSSYSTFKPRRFRCVLACDVVDLACNRNILRSRRDAYYIVKDKDHVLSAELLVFFDQAAPAQQEEGKQASAAGATAGVAAAAADTAGLLSTVATGEDRGGGSSASAQRNGGGETLRRRHLEGAAGGSGAGSSRGPSNGAWTGAPPPSSSSSSSSSSSAASASSLSSLSTTLLRILQMVLVVALACVVAALFARQGSWRR